MFRARAFRRARSEPPALSRGRDTYPPQAPHPLAPPARHPLNILATCPPPPERTGRLRSPAAAVAREGAACGDGAITPPIAARRRCGPRSTSAAGCRLRRRGCGAAIFPSCAGGAISRQRSRLHFLPLLAAVARPHCDAHPQRLGDTSAVVSLPPFLASPPQPWCVTHSTWAPPAEPPPPPLLWVLRRGRSAAAAVCRPSAAGDASGDDAGAIVAPLASFGFCAAGALCHMLAAGAASGGDAGVVVAPPPSFGGWCASPFCFLLVRCRRRCPYFFGASMSFAFSAPPRLATWGLAVADVLEMSGGRACDCVCNVGGVL